MRIIIVAFSNIEYTIQLSEGLAKLADVTLMIPEQQAKRFQDIIEPHLTLQPFNAPRLRYPTNILFVYKMIKRIKNINPDIIHIQRGHPWFNFALFFLKRYCLITTIHDVVLHSGDKESSIVPAFTHKLAINHAKQIIVHGNKLKEEMVREYKRAPEDIDVLFRGINSIYVRYAKDKNIEEEGHSILFFGRIWEYKGLNYLIEAEPIITKEIPDAKIVIAGRGEDFDKYYEMMVNKDKFIVYNQHIANEMVAELFQKAGVVVFPYKDASQSGVVPLAYAFKKPVIITKVGSLPEVVDDGITGYIIPPGDTQQLASAIIRILKDDEKRKQMGENAYKKATEELSWDRIAETTIKVYKKALAK